MYIIAFHNYAHWYSTHGKGKLPDIRLKTMEKETSVVINRVLFSITSMDAYQVNVMRFHSL